ncbi:hypothetical protein V8E54_011498 [Elaphomyces granulatus]
MHEGFGCIVIKQAEDIWQRIIGLDAGENANTRSGQHQQKLEVYSDGFNGYLKLDSTFAANGQEHGVPPILPLHGNEAGVYGQNGYGTYERTPPTLPIKDGRRAVRMTSALTAATTSGRKSMVRETPTSSKNDRAGLRDNSAK